MKYDLSFSVAIARLNDKSNGSRMASRDFFEVYGFGARASQMIS